MDVEFINPFLNSTVNVIETMAAQKLTAGKPALKKGNKTWGVVTGIIGMVGEKVAGNLIISFDEASILAIVEGMLGEKPPSLDESVVDAVGEITNMISGGAKKALNEKGFTFDMASPIVLVGKDIEMTQLTDKPIIVIPFTTQHGEFVVEASLAAKKAK